MENYGLVFAAPKSNSGKTMVVCGMTEVFKRKNMKVATFKCGPDYIDPMFHRRILGVQSGNLDTFFTDADTVRYIYNKKAETADITLVEGVMGYYDGLGGQSVEASTYDVAKALNLPVVLVVDCKGVSVSIAAVIKGIADYKADSNIKAVILNRVSPMYYQRLKTVVEQSGIEVIGYIPEKEELKLQSRHLGLVTPAEIADFEKWVSDVADTLEKYVDIDRLHGLAKCNVPDGKESTVPVLKDNVRIAVARDDAFSFYYDENIELIEKIGGEIAYFSPLNDEKLPENIDGIILGGGYPELYADRLEKNESMRNEIYKACEKGVPLIAECGGFMYLQKSLEGNDGKNYDMCGVLGGNAFKTSKLSRFGYIETEINKNCLLGEKGEKIRGHEFHYWDCSENGNGFTAKKPLGKTAYDCIVSSDKIVAGFPHFYFLSNVNMLFNFMQTCLSFKAARLSKLHWDSIAKPIDSLGLLEENVVKLCSVTKNPLPYDISKRALVIMCGDHGVVSEGVTQTGSDVTKIVADNFANNCSTVCYMAGCANVDVFVFDVGIDCEEYPEKNVVKNKVINRKVARGTKNIAAEEGMTLSQCEKAVNTGIEAVRDLKLQGYKIIATGEMGIGNTTPTSALCAILLDKSPTEVTGRGAGLSNEGLNKKYEVVKRIVERVKNLGITDAFEILAQAGGYDIAGLVGVFLGGVKYDVPIVIDGAISSVAALVANEIDPRVKNIAIASHQSDESTGKFALDAMGLSALVHGKMCLGEGTGAMTIFPILDMALEVYGKLEFFGDFDIEPYKRFE